MKTIFSSIILWVVGASALAVAASAAHAQDLRAPFELETARVLPKGVRNPRFKNVYTGIEGRFSNGGVEEPIAKKLNKVVSWGDILEAQSTQTDKDLVRGLLSDAELNEAGSPGQTTGAVSIAAQVMVPVLAVGLTERWTLAAAVPIYRVDVQADSGFVKSADGQKFVDAAGGTAIKQSEAAAKLNDAVNQKLTRLGYQPIRSQQFTAVSDTRVVSKYVLLTDEAQTLTLKNEVTVPTGKVPDPTNVLTVPVGDGQWDIGAGVIYDRIVAKDFRWNAFGGYLVQLPAHIDRRLPTSATDSLSKDQESILQDLGDVVTAGTSVTYELPGTGLYAGTGYQFQFMNKTSFKDGKYESYRYRLLENEFPHRALHTGLATIGFSTVEFYKQKKFVLPLQANLSYSAPITGSNATTNNMLAAELVLFF